MEEIFKDIEGFEGIYKVSNLGNVKSLNYNHTGKSKLLRIHDDNKGYLTVCLFKLRKKKSFTVHRLVASAFIPNPDNKRTVNHKDGVKTNNHIDNLEWNTYSENIQHAFDTGLKKVSEKQRAKFNKLVLDTSTGIFYDSATEVSKTFGINKQTIINKLCGSSRNNTNFIYV